jgi:cytochrome c
MKRLTLVLIGLLCWALNHSALAADGGTADEAVAMVKSAITYYKENGRDKTIATINARQQFIDRDLYVVIYDMQGKNLAHGANARMVNKDLLEMKDMDGKPYMRERIDLIKAKGKGWQDYKFNNPVSQKIEPKTMYVERYDDLIFGCGIYKK